MCVAPRLCASGSDSDSDIGSEYDFDNEGR